MFPSFGLRCGRPWWAASVGDRPRGRVAWVRVRGLRCPSRVPAFDGPGTSRPRRSRRAARARPAVPECSSAVRMASVEVARRSCCAPGIRDLGETAGEQDPAMRRRAGHVADGVAEQAAEHAQGFAGARIARQRRGGDPSPACRSRHRSPCSLRSAACRRIRPGPDNAFDRHVPAFLLEFGSTAISVRCRRSARRTPARWPAPAAGPRSGCRRAAPGQCSRAPGQARHRGPGRHSSINSVVGASRMRDRLPKSLDPPAGRSSPGGISVYARIGHGRLAEMKRPSGHRGRQTSRRP